MAEMKLFGVWASPFSRRIEMALKLKGVEYEFIEEDMKNKSPLLLEYNPIHKKIPVLVHSGKPIAESLVILEYIDETWEGPAIFPKDPYERAQARFLAKFLDETFFPPMWKACCSRGEERQKAKEEAIELLGFLDNEIKGKKFFGGDSIGLVDIVGNLVAYWCGILGEIVGIEFVPKDKYPNFFKWINEYNNCSFVKENLPQKDKLIAFLKARFEVLDSSK
ncbi:Glutathione S-transferase [Handroanthus impetiginosus]|uniref:Probable glutathione S-transferase n=1 Tax=Handroanthus impetiginosus TaxID=429701 RepID=A0A2G9GSJ3_9LAMI|nr:Glutathione S-transferase [Handroanthus impetiginosus]